MQTIEKRELDPSSRELPLDLKFRCLEDEALIARANELARRSGLSLPAAKILASREIFSHDAVREYLYPSFREHLPDPSEIKNLPAACDLVLSSIEAKESIVIYADFDVDGLSSGSQLLLFLQALGARVDIYVPNRFTEGYGLVMSAIHHLASRGTQLLITVDCGISSAAEFAQAKALGMKSIVLDHHIPPGNPQQLPPANVVVDPAQDGCPFQPHKLAAAGLTWMFLVQLRRVVQERWRPRIEKGELLLPDPKDFLDLAAMGTICDMVPLLGVNRLLAARGLEALERTTRPGLVALKRVAGVSDAKRFTAGHVGFGLGPRINAAGRLAEGRDVVTLLTTSDSIRAQSLAELLDRLNEKRKSIEDQVREVCLSAVRADVGVLARSALVLFGENFHPGVIGIVAQRMVEKFHRPALVMAPGEMLHGGKMVPVLKGSIRSVSGFHVADALLALKSYLLSGGGHAEAGGCTVLPERLPEFREAFLALADELLPHESLARRCTVDLRLSLRDLDLALAKELQGFAPFGIGNPSPVFFSPGVKVESVSSIGNKHLKIRFSDEGAYVNAVAWGFQGHARLRKGERVDIVYQVEINSYQGVSSLQLCLREVV